MILLPLLSLLGYASSLIKEVKYNDLRQSSENSPDLFINARAANHRNPESNLNEADDFNSTNKHNSLRRNNKNDLKNKYSLDNKSKEVSNYTKNKNGETVDTNDIGVDNNSSTECLPIINEQLSCSNHKKSGISKSANRSKFDLIDSPVLNIKDIKYSLISQDNLESHDLFSKNTTPVLSHQNEKVSSPLYDRSNLIKNRNLSEQYSPTQTIAASAEIDTQYSLHQSKEHNRNYNTERNNSSDLNTEDYIEKSPSILYKKLKSNNVNYNNHSKMSKGSNNTTSQEFKYPDSEAMVAQKILNTNKNKVSHEIEPSFDLQLNNIPELSDTFDPFNNGNLDYCSQLTLPTQIRPIERQVGLYGHFANMRNIKLHTMETQLFEENDTFRIVGENSYLDTQNSGVNVNINSPSKQDLNRCSQITLPTQIRPIEEQVGLFGHFISMNNNKLNTMYTQLFDDDENFRIIGGSSDIDDSGAESNQLSNFNKDAKINGKVPATTYDKSIINQYVSNSQELSEFSPDSLTKKGEVGQKKKYVSNSIPKKEDSVISKNYRFNGSDSHSDNDKTTFLNSSPVYSLDKIDSLKLQSSPDYSTKD
ncbi:hypothetical protein K502DRAFT_328731 [Neoconidiobolus thromboides FSU 785]|nr:hypothetical protein K502DRAFT_328731 [Neoconidiobolus thromboides FSU 785]